MFFTVFEPKTIGQKKADRTRYQCAYVETLTVDNKGVVDPTHGMLTIRRRPINTALTPRKLGARRIYEVGSILRPIDAVPSTLPDLNNAPPSVFFVNNYIDWDEYNTWFSPTFDKDWVKSMANYRRQHSLRQATPDAAQLAEELEASRGEDGVVVDQDLESGSDEEPVGYPEVPTRQLRPRV